MGSRDENFRTVYWRSPRQLRAGPADKALFALAAGGMAFGQETLPPINDGKVPETFESLWAGYTVNPQGVQLFC